MKSVADPGREPGEVGPREPRESEGGHRQGGAHSSGLDSGLVPGGRLGDDGAEEVDVFAIEASA